MNSDIHKYENSDGISFLEMS